MTLVAIAVAAGCLGNVANAAPPEKLTEFQWALASRGALLLIPIKDFLYPAKLTGEGEIETRPTRIAVTLYETGQKMTPLLQSVISPFELDPARWAAQKRVDDKWIDAEAFVFIGGQFYLTDSASTLSAVEPAALRFVPLKP
jgi:hypothetical protein